MGRTDFQRTAYLALDELAPNPQLARRLPADLAWRFHALPLAEDNGRVTVVMADPADAEARDAVINALGVASCVVQGDTKAIDALLAEVWGSKTQHSLHVAVCTLPDPTADDVWTYAQAIGGSLGAQVSRVDTAEGMAALIAEEEGIKPDLVILEEQNRPLIRRLFCQSRAEGGSRSGHSDLPFAVLVARRPRWPLKNILLVICGEEVDDAAVHWVLCLARHNRSRVTVLAIVPPVPAMYGNQTRMAQDLPALLTAESPLGRQMRQVARNLVDWEIEGTLRLRQGSPDWQICREVTTGDYDLLAVTDKPCRWWLRWLDGDLVEHLLRRVDRPVLVARPTTA